MTKNPETRGLHGTGAIGRPVYATDPHIDPPDLYPAPTYIVVVGKSPMIIWDSQRRHRFNLLCKIALEFGLSVQELDVGIESPRKAWVSHRIDSSYALDTIKDFPGITFEDFAVDVYMRKQPKTDAELQAARARARSAINRFVADGVVVRLRFPGQPQRLWTREAAPARGSEPDLSRSVPPKRTNPDDGKLWS